MEILDCTNRSVYEYEYRTECMHRLYNQILSNGPKKGRVVGRLRHLRRPNSFAKSCAVNKPMLCWHASPE